MKFLVLYAAFYFLLHFSTFLLNLAELTEIMVYDEAANFFAQRKKIVKLTDIKIWFKWCSLEN